MIRLGILPFGRALALLRDQGVLIIGSGLNYHNRAIFKSEARVPSTEFGNWPGARFIASLGAAEKDIWRRHRIPSYRFN